MTNKFTLRAADSCGRGINRNPAFKGMDDAVDEMREGGSSELEIAQRFYDYARECMEDARERHIIYLNQIVAEAIGELSRLEASLQLSKIAEHAMEESASLYEKDPDSTMRSVLGRHARLNLKVMKSSIPDLIHVAKELVAASEDVKRNGVR